MEEEGKIQSAPMPSNPTQNLAIVPDFRSFIFPE